MPSLSVLKKVPDIKGLEINRPGGRPIYFNSREMARAITLDKNLVLKPEEFHPGKITISTPQFEFQGILRRTSSSTPLNYPRSLSPLVAEG
jgi:hypothetical protein